MLVASPSSREGDKAESGDLAARGPAEWRDLRPFFSIKYTEFRAAMRLCQGVLEKGEQEEEPLRGVSTTSLQAAMTH